MSATTSSRSVPSIISLRSCCRIVPSSKRCPDTVYTRRTICPYYPDYESSFDGAMVGPTELPLLSNLVEFDPGDTACF